MLSPRLPLFVDASVPDFDYDRLQVHSTCSGFVRDLQLGRQRSRYDREIFPSIHPYCLEIYNVWRGCWEKLAGLVLHEALEYD
jgi:hypothetical protein